MVDVPQGVSTGPLIHIKLNIINTRLQNFDRVVDGDLKPVQTEVRFNGHVLSGQMEWRGIFLIIYSPEKFFLLI